MGVIPFSPSDENVTMRLIGWQHLGIVLSIVWAVGAAIFADHIPAICAASAT